MRPPEQISPERINELREFRKTKWPGNEFKRFLCVWLRCECGLSTDAIARTNGWHVNTVRIIQKDFIRRGIAALQDSPKGGRYHALMEDKEEKEFLSGFEESGTRGTILDLFGN